MRHFSSTTYESRLRCRTRWFIAPCQLGAETFSPSQKDTRTPGILIVHSLQGSSRFHRGRLHGKQNSPEFDLLVCTPWTSTLPASLHCQPCPRIRRAPSPGRTQSNPPSRRTIPRPRAPTTCSRRGSRLHRSTPRPSDGSVLSSYLPSLATRVIATTLLRAPGLGSSWPSWKTCTPISPASRTVGQNNVPSDVVATYM